LGCPTKERTIKEKRLWDEKYEGGVGVLNESELFKGGEKNVGKGHEKRAKKWERGKFV